MFDNDDLENINVNYQDSIQDESREPMTTVVGIKSNTCVVFASDSQWTSNVKAFSSKLFKINEAIGLGASGTRPYINMLVERLRQDIKTDDLTAETTLKHRIDGILCELYRDRVTERSIKLGYLQVENLFDATALLGARLSNGEYVLYRLSMRPPDPMIDGIDNYESIGSGAKYAYLLLRQQTRVLLQSGQNISDTDLEANTWLATLIINEIKTFDTATSGNTIVAVIDQNGFVEYTRKQVIEKYEFTTGKLVDLAQTLGIDRDTARSIFPET